MNRTGFYGGDDGKGGLRMVCHSDETLRALGISMGRLAEHGYYLQENGPYGVTNRLGVNDAKMPGSMYQNLHCPPALEQLNGYHPGMMTGNEFNSPCSAPFGSRKRSLDDEGQDEFKRQRISGGYEANMMIYSGGHPVTPPTMPLQLTMAARPELMYNTSAMEHQTSMVEAKGYEDLYLYDIISQMHGS